MGNSGYVGAPYNFVPFYKDVVSVEKEQMMTHDKIEHELLTGEIAYTATAKLPIFISDGKEQPDFVKNERGEYMIPGSSMRGLIRSNAQILGLSSFDEDIDDYRLMYRNVAAGIEKKRYGEILGADIANIGDGKSVSVLKNVKAGYIEKVGSEYFIYQTEVDKISDQFGEMNYYVLSERTIAEDLRRKDTSFSYFKEHPNCLEHVMKDGFKKIQDRGRIHYKGTTNQHYTEGYYNISYDVTNTRQITAVGNPGTYKHEGYLVCTGHMNEKKSKYIIPKMDQSKEHIQISKADVDAFQIDYNKKKNTLRNNKKYYNLPENGEIKPVFYIQLNRLYFGFTPRLRLFYDYTIKNGYKQTKKPFDYAKSIFGTIYKKDNKNKNENIGYKSKVAFTDAVLCGNVNKSEESSVILGEPKPTSYLDYLVQKGGKTTYNTQGFELRGVKQYWLHKTLESYSYSNAGKNDKVFTHMKPLKEGSRFTGSVRFRNLTKAELGLLLWSICLEDDCLMNIGMGKSLGYGVIGLEDVTLKIFDTEKAYDLNQTLDWQPMMTGDIKTYIDAYKSEINGKLRGKDIDSLSSIQSFFKMHDRNLIPDNHVIRYMSIDKKEYQSRKRPLDSIDEVIKKSERSAKEKKIVEKPVIEKKIAAEKKELRSGSVYQAEIKGYQGKKVKFLIDGNYILTALENIKGIDDLNKKNMKEMLPAGKKVTVELKKIKVDNETIYKVSIQ